MQIFYTILNFSNPDKKNIVVAVIFLLISLNLPAQILPAHDEIRIVILSDEVNPHNLSDAELMQPGDLSVTLANVASLNSSILEIPTNNLEQVTTELQRPKTDPLAYDILIYFAHRIPDNGNSAQLRQDNFVTAVEGFLLNGGGVISYHHGIYQTSGKQAMQSLLGAQATGAVPWDTVNGQSVIFVGGNHFIGAHEINYNTSIAYENSAHSIIANNYPAFTNTPDERYPFMDFNNGNNTCEIQTIFESDYANNGTTHLLSYTKQCPNWQSKVFIYQPGEYQPNATSGNNLQILLNAIYYLSDFRWDTIFVNSFES